MLYSKIHIFLHFNISEIETADGVFSCFHCSAVNTLAIVCPSASLVVISGSIAKQLKPMNISAKKKKKIT